MTDFEATRELAQELAETGSVQLPKSVLPEQEHLETLLQTI